MFEERYDVRVMHAWGMTEMSPLGTICTLKPELEALPRDERYGVQEKQGHPPFGVELKITDDDGSELPWDGKTFGRLKVRGPAVARSLFQGARRKYSTRTASSIPATSPTSTSTATCASPTARRT